VFAVLMLVAGGWRNPFYLYFWSVAGLTSVCWSARATYGLIPAGCAWQVVCFGLVSRFGADHATRGVTLSQWPAPFLGYVAIGFPFAYVRSRFDDLRAGVAVYESQAANAVNAATTAALAEERSAIAFRLHHRIRQTFPAMRLRLGTLRATHPRASQDMAETIDRLDTAIESADTQLAAFFEQLRHLPVSTQPTGTSESGPQAGVPVGSPRDDPR
jgi:signal transduction histidine kinase